MRILLSTIGSRGDVQPLVALAVALRALGEEVRMCVPPDFGDSIEALGVTVMPIGPSLRATGKASLPAAPPTPGQRRLMVEGTVRTQFDTIAEAARGCDLVVGATALQVAAPSVAEHLGIPYVFVAYCPAVLPSPRHAPPVLAMLGEVPSPGLRDYSDAWARDAVRWNETWREPINARRAALGLAPIDDVRSHVHTPHPWLAADPVLGPWPHAPDPNVLQAGAWILPDRRPLGDEVEAFLDAGEAPLYFGFGSMRAPTDLGHAMVAAARAHGRRAIVSRGWAGLSLPGDSPDCLLVDEVNHQALFPRVAAVVHHGGAGTTTAAASAGVPQVVVPQHYDQHYWSGRVQALGMGVAHVHGVPTSASLAEALSECLRQGTLDCARTIAPRVSVDGAVLAARRLRDLAGGALAG